MDDPSSPDRRDALLERALIEEYLSDQGHSFEGLASLDATERERVTLEATAYAAMRLAEFLYGE